MVTVTAMKTVWAARKTVEPVLWSVATGNVTQTVESLALTALMIAEAAVLHNASLKMEFLRIVDQIAAAVAAGIAHQGKHAIVMEHVSRNRELMTVQHCSSAP
jgi:hypothetical protein